MRSPERLFTLVLALACTGCPALGTHLGADTVEPGRWQLSAAGGVGVFRDVEQKTTLPGPQIEVGVRRGVGRDVDVGVEAFLFGLDAGVRWRMLHRTTTSIAIAPSLGVSRFPESGTQPNSFYVWGRLPIITGVRLSDRATINFGPTLLYGYFISKSGGGTHGLLPGALVNFAIRIGARARILPELALYRSVAGDVPVRGWAFYFGPGVLVDL